MFRSQLAPRNGASGRSHVLAGDCQVVDPETMQPVPADGKTIGEITLRGNTVMKGYLKTQKIRQKLGGWFHSGDLAVMHPDGYAEVKDRSKDIIISGGENISSLKLRKRSISTPILWKPLVPVPMINGVKHQASSH